MVRVNPDPYLVLGVAPTATQAEITHAYRTHLRAHHPDTRPAQSAHTADEHLRQALAAYVLPPHPARPPATPPAQPPTHSHRCVPARSAATASRMHWPALHLDGPDLQLSRLPNRK